MSGADATIPEIVDLHDDLAAQALEGLSWQMAGAARLLSRGDFPQAVEAYRRGIDIVRNFASPSMRVVADSLAAQPPSPAPSETTKLVLPAEEAVPA